MKLLSLSDIFECFIQFHKHINAGVLVLIKTTNMPFEQFILQKKLNVECLDWFPFS